jgi:hypothetical protein
MDTCLAILQTGPRRGEYCGKRTQPFSNFCRRHLNNEQEEDNILCEYLPRGIKLSSTNPEEIDTLETSSEQEKIKALNGYLNVKIHDIPLVIMSKIHGEDHLTKSTIAKQLSEAVNYITSRPDIYNTQPYDNFILHRITYDAIRGIYIAT